MKKNIKKTIVSEYERKNPRNVFKILNLLNDIEMSYEVEEDNNNNYRSEKTKEIRISIYQCF